METRTVVSEFIGTLLLVFFAVGSLVVAGDYINAVGIALAFGFTVIALGYALGRVSGCHINPAVTLGALIARRIEPRTAVEYWIAQLAGAVVGSALLFLLAKQVPGLKTHNAFGTNGYGDRSPVRMDTGGAFLAEVMLTFLFVFVFLTVTHQVALVGTEPIPIGLTLAAVHLVGIPLTWASVNPARSFGPALFAGGGALSQLWLFLLAPLIGAVLAAAVHLLTHPEESGGLSWRLPRRTRGRTGRGDDGTGGADDDGRGGPDIAI